MNVFLLIGLMNIPIVGFPDRRNLKNHSVLRHWAMKEKKLPSVLICLNKDTFSPKRNRLQISLLTSSEINNFYSPEITRKPQVL